MQRCARNGRGQPQFVLSFHFSCSLTVCSVVNGFLRVSVGCKATGTGGGGAGFGFAGVFASQMAPDRANPLSATAGPSGVQRGAPPLTEATMELAKKGRITTHPFLTSAKGLKCPQRHFSHPTSAGKRNC